MNNQIRNIFNSLVCEVSIAIIIGCMIITSLSIEPNGELNGVALLSSIFGALVLLGLLTWAIIKLTSKREVKEMPIKSRIVIESISRLLFMYWLYITVGALPAIIWAVFILWDGIKSIRKIAL